MATRFVIADAVPKSDDAGKPPVLPLWYSVGVAVVLLAVTLYGLLVEGAYRAPPGVRETLPQTLRGQDLLTLLTVPVLLWAGMRARAGSLRAHIVWLALLFYIAYTYLMYVVTPFNEVFLLYVAAIGLASYGVLNGLMRIDVTVASAAFTEFPRRGLGAFLLAVGALFASLWLAQILPAIRGEVPEALIVYDIPNMVHVLDLAVVLPLMIATGVLLFRGHQVAPVLATLLLVKMTTVGLALIFMNGFGYAEGSEINVAETAIWGVIVVFGAAWLVVVMRRIHRAPDGWLRPGLWAA
ncbi:MAG TPA: hypothetical protein VFZ72_19660 [Jiangellaceae bacterium]